MTKINQTFKRIHFLHFIVKEAHRALKPPLVEYLPVNIVLDAQQVIGHGLQRELMQNGCHGIKATIQNEQLSTRFIWTLEASEQTFVCQRLSLQYYRECSYIIFAIVYSGRFF